jgi:hypothetical protein
MLLLELGIRQGQGLHVSEGENQIIWFKDPAGFTLKFQQERNLQACN